LGVPLPEEKPAPAKESGGSVLGWLNPFGSAPKPAPPPPRLDKRQQEKLNKLEADYDSKKAEIAARWRQIGQEGTPIQVKPRKADVRVTHFGLAWVPHWRLPNGKLETA